MTNVADVHAKGCTSNFGSVPTLLTPESTFTYREKGALTCGNGAP